MTWEEYQATDFYKESHPDWNYKPTREERIEEEMRNYIGCLDAYRARARQERAEMEASDEDFDDYGDEDIPLSDVSREGHVVRYVTTKIWNGRVRGLLCTGTYKQCVYRKYEYNVACIGSEWEWAGVERIVAESEEEMEEILDGYRECDYYDDYDDYDDY